MRPILPALFLVLSPLLSSAQSSGNMLDTLVIQSFILDPSDGMLPFPSGSDTEWVNWDGDNGITLCDEDNPVPGEWFWDVDLGSFDDPPTNFAFTSCSYLTNPNLANFNWLITAPISIPDSTVFLSWRSAPFQGPGYMDGYKVLVSTGSNNPLDGDFKDTLFVAAEMTAALDPNSLDPDKYIFSPGYVHADRFTDTDYFFLVSPGDPSYACRLEPHEVSLKKFSGQSVYIAFLHDSKYDYVLQIDDIAVVQVKTTATHAPSEELVSFSLSPNPALDMATASWKFSSPRKARLLLTNTLGQLVRSYELDRSGRYEQMIDLQQLPAGIYACTLVAENVHYTQKLVKR